MIDVRSSEEKPQNWMNTRWRPMMGWMYMVTCITDFVIFPILWSILQAYLSVPVTQWEPLTLQGAGLFHVAMGAVLGLTAWGRTQEKINGVSTSGYQYTSHISSSHNQNSAPVAMSSTGKPMPVHENFKEI